MLEKSDLMAIENLIDKKFDQRFAEQDRRINERFAEQDRRINERFAEQDRKMDEKFAEQNKAIDKKFTKLDRMDLLLLDEIERNRNILETRMDKMQQNMDEIKNEVRQLYRITGQENERADMEFKGLHRKDSELDERVTRLENCVMV